MKECKSAILTKMEIDGVEQEVLVMPITRLDCIEDTADTVDSADGGDYIPVIDSADNGQMKKIKFSALIAAISAGALNGKTPDEFADAEHTHTTADITDFPESLPANGGNAATVGGAAVMTTAALGLHLMASGTDEPTSATCPPGCWYGQYE